MIFDHIGIFVKNLEYGRKRLSSILPITKFTDPVDDKFHKVSVQFGIDNTGIRYELVAPFGKDNPAESVLSKGENIQNHICYLVDDLDSEVKRLRSEGAIPLGSPKPGVAFNNNRVVFFLTPLRFVIELIEIS